ncbi:2-octaprenyl-6-methoxyphenyl hydroxylase [Candidatus Photodesmus katoptron]|uniref:2-octaprenyl-6-methoxyphenyl hydroxylase n=1 Tax=Candidatus Photodesmus anomalopis TaxID=28176 RepID=UPI000558AD30|nr:2-octaprenyl-6-methoxyphenyl hydroxylase [Candidatus Photodesmus katoptron]
MKKFDVIIAGGGIVGVTFALSLNVLSNEKFSIALIEPFKNTLNRSIALSHGTVELMKKFKLWEAIIDIATPINQIQISERSNLGIVNICTENYFIDAIGYVVELSHVLDIYYNRLKKMNNIELFFSKSVTGVKQKIDKVKIILTDSKQLTAKLLVAADGSISACCKKIRLDYQEYDFKQAAVVAKIISSEKNNGMAFKRFTKSGSIALLPISSNNFSLVWCLSPNLAREVMFYNEEKFLDSLQKEFGWYLGKLLKASNKATYPLYLRYQRKNISHRFAIIGNAAQTLHPMAAQGFNLGMRDVASLAEEIISSPHDIGDYDNLIRFNKHRNADRQATIKLTSSLVKLFASNSLSIKIGRSVGLFAIENIFFLKMSLLHRMLGFVNH